MRKIFISVVVIVMIFFIGLNVFLGTIEKKSLSQVPRPQVVMPPVEASELTSVDSPDGKLTLSVKKTKVESGIHYSFSIAGKEIFAKTVSSAVSFSIPRNTWSPNNKYVFLKETAVTGVKFFVLSTSGDPNNQDDQTANITDLFAKKYPNLKIKDVTGWGGANLVIVNSDSSFWFEMPSHAFIQLSTHF